MKYVSTRGGAEAIDFESVTLAGLAPDGGLYLPESWPTLSSEQIRDMRGAPYWEVAVEVMAPFIHGSLASDELMSLCQAAYADFSHAAVTPLVQLDESTWLLELFHGPTLAFKDVALQLLGRLFETFLTRRSGHLTIVGATSGDTGSAAIRAVAGRANIDVFMLHPHGRVSEVQRRQMTTVNADNVYNIAIDGSFDDAQAMVKRMFADQSMTSRFHIAAVNSINWARLMAQVVYYFYAAIQLGAPDRKVVFSVPTGNFGDVFAGYVAAQMGLPVERLIVATNVNDILHRALSAGDYSQGKVMPTDAPSMDIQVSSNFERLLFCEGGRDGQALAEQMRDFDVHRAIRLTDLQREGAWRLFHSRAVAPELMEGAMRRTYLRTGQIVDPHTAIGLEAAQQLASADEIDPCVPVVALATAHPAKFPDTVERATGVRPELPRHMGPLLDRQERYDRLPGDYETVRDYVAARATPAS